MVLRSPAGSSPNLAQPRVVSATAAGYPTLTSVSPRVQPRASAAMSLPASQRIGADGGSPSNRYPTEGSLTVPANTLAAVAPIDDGVEGPLVEERPERGSTNSMGSMGQDSGGAASMRPSTESTPMEEQMSVEDQIRGERLWWSENTSLQVRKMQFTMQQELEKAMAALRENFQQQLDIERQHRQAIFSEIKKELSAQRVSLTEVEQRGDRVMEDSGNAAMSPHHISAQLADCLYEANNAKDEVLRNSAQLRQEFEYLQAEQSASFTEVAAERERSELKVSAVEAALADVRRDLIMQQAVVDNLRQDLSLQSELRQNLAAQQATINDVRRDFNGLDQRMEGRRSEQESTTRSIDDLSSKLKQMTSTQAHNEAKLRAEMTSVRSSMQTSVGSQELQNMENSRAASEHATSRALHQSASRFEAIEVKLANNAADWEMRCHEVEGVREDLSRIKQDLSEEKIERARGITGVCTHAEEVVQHGLQMFRQQQAENGGGSQVKSVAKKLEAETQERAKLTGAVESLRNTLLDVVKNVETTQGRIDETQRSVEAGISKANDALHSAENAREASLQLLEDAQRKVDEEAPRRAEDTQMQAQILALHVEIQSCNAEVADLREHSIIPAIERTNIAIEEAKTTSNATTEQINRRVLELATEIQGLRDAQFTSIEGMREGHQADMAALHAQLAEAVPREGTQVEATQDSRGTGLVDLTQSGYQVATGSMSTIEIESQLRSLGTSLRSEFASRVEGVSAELNSRAADIEANMEARLLELNVGPTASPHNAEERLQILGSNLEERLQQLESAGNTEERLLMLEAEATSREASSQQMGEILNLTQIITAGTEKLAERIASETAMWRSAKLQSEARFNYLEKIIGGYSGSVGDAASTGEPDMLALASEPDLPPLMSEDLKDTLESLVSKLNRTLKPEAQVSLGSGSAELPSAPRRESIPLGLSSGGLRSATSPGLREAGETVRNRSTSRGPFTLQARPSSPGRTMSTDTGLRGNHRVIGGGVGQQRSESHNSGQTNVQPGLRTQSPPNMRHTQPLPGGSGNRDNSIGSNNRSLDDSSNRSLAGLAAAVPKHTGPPARKADNGNMFRSAGGSTASGTGSLSSVPKGTDQTNRLLPSQASHGSLSPTSSLSGSRYSASNHGAVPGGRLAGAQPGGHR